MKSRGFQNIEVDDAFTSLKIGSELVVSVQPVSGKLQCTWDDAWANSEEFVSSKDVMDGKQKADDMLMRVTGTSKGKGSAKGGAPQ